MDEIKKKKTLQLFPSPVFVVGCCDGETVHAFGGSWLGQCSFQPPIVWIAVGKETRPQTLLDKGKVFTISILRAEQKKVATTFFKTPPPADGKFGEIPYRLSPCGSPILEECLAWLECKVVSKAEPGDHVLFYGEVIECEFFEEAPVLTTVTTGWKYGG